jgi:hypothetical protein
MTTPWRNANAPVTSIAIVPKNFDFNSADFQFRKCGPLNCNVIIPWAPVIMKAAKELKGIDKPADNRVTLNKILKLINSDLDCPIEVVREIDTNTTLTEPRKALYYKTMYQTTPISFNLSYMYDKYYADTDLNINKYTAIEKNFIRSCKYSKTPLNDIYKKEYYKNSKWL